MTTKTFALALNVAGILLCTGVAQAITFDFDTKVTGDNPVGTNIATLEIVDTAADTVTLTLTHNASSAAGQFISKLYLNVDPYVFLVQSGQTPASKFDGGIQQSLNGLLDAGLNFDLSQEFQVSGANSGANRLKPGESVSFMLTGTGLTASSFLSNAVPQGGNRDDVLAMIHLQGIPGGGSVKLAAVPEPASMAALGLGIAALLRRRAR
ncbi:MAG: PEP-CTERM sorting domain-containing protein [Fimbriimonadaceae bacterium]|nr:PEP-CTERM sorting domain-containing protein [Fimbriimonadaceae bacterium]QYK56900.1 MAG: PEP-CTERM sorting domain-containing protein [Fimbriimonadaceae bacterium]